MLRLGTASVGRPPSRRPREREFTNSIIERLAERVLGGRRWHATVCVPDGAVFVSGTVGRDGRDLAACVRGRSAYSPRRPDGAVTLR